MIRQQRSPRKRFLRTEEDKKRNPQSVANFGIEGISRLVYELIAITPISRISLIDNLKLWWILSIGISHDETGHLKEPIWGLFGDAEVHRHRQLYESLSKRFKKTDDVTTKVFTGFALLASEMEYHVSLVSHNGSHAEECHLSTFMEKELVELILALLSISNEDLRCYTIFLVKMTFQYFKYEAVNAVRESITVQFACRSAYLCLEVVKRMDSYREFLRDSLEDFEDIAKFLRSHSNIPDDIETPFQEYAENVLSSLGSPEASPTEVRIFTNPLI